MKVDNSYVLYIHRELGNTPNWWKCGRSITPYSAVRLRQRLLLNPFELEHVYFGDPQDIAWLELQVHNRFPRDQKGLCNQELVNCELSELTEYIDHLITLNGLSVKHLGSNYAAHKSGDCPYGFPAEKHIHTWAESKLDQVFGQARSKNPIRAGSVFHDLFLIDSEDI